MGGEVGWLGGRCSIRIQDSIKRCGSDERRGEDGRPDIEGMKKSMMEKEGWD